MPWSPEEYADQGFRAQGPVVSVTPKRRSPPSLAPGAGGRTDSGSFSQLVQADGNRNAPAGSRRHTGLEMRAGRPPDASALPLHAGPGRRRGRCRNPSLSTMSPPPRDLLGFSETFRTGLSARRTISSPRCAPRGSQTPMAIPCRSSHGALWRPMFGIDSTSPLFLSMLLLAVFVIAGGGRSSEASPGLSATSTTWAHLASTQDPVRCCEGWSRPRRLTPSPRAPASRPGSVGSAHPSSPSPGAGPAL